MEWSHVAQDRGQWCAVVNTAVTFPCTMTFLTTGGTCYVAVVSTMRSLVNCTSFVQYRIYDLTKIEESH
jgi:hypothetical protein